VRMHPKSNDMLSQREEARLIEASRRVLLDGGYPNPDRVGCPGAKRLKALAERKADLRESKHAVVHIGSCSPCFIEYRAFQKQAARRKVVELVLASAAVLILAAIGAWVWRGHLFHGTRGKLATNVPYQKITVDLRNRLILRGEERSSANSGPIELPRGRIDLTLLLPKGSGPGNYEVQVSTETESPLVTAGGTAASQNGVSVLKATLDTSKMNAGTYLLGIRQGRGEEREYPLIVK